MTGFPIARSLQVADIPAEHISKPAESLHEQSFYGLFSPGLEQFVPAFGLRDDLFLILNQPFGSKRRNAVAGR
jgi:hypothetical protein